MAKKSRAQKEQDTPVSTSNKPLSKYALKKLAQQKSRWEEHEKVEVVTTADDDEYFAQQEQLKAQATARAARAAMEGASGIEKVSETTSTKKKSVTLARKGRVITVIRKEPKRTPKSLEHYEKLKKHNQAVRDARNEALSKLQAQGKDYVPAVSKNSKRLPEKVEFERKSIFTCGVEIKDRVPDLTDLAERMASIQPHNRRDQMLFAPIKRTAKPIVGTDFMVKFLDTWSRNNDIQGIFSDLFEQVKLVRKTENGVAYNGLPAFLKFLEGSSKNDIIDQYAFEFRRFIKRREITDFISAMQGPALDWMKKRHALEPYYAFVYFDTYPIHVKLGKKKVISEQVLFILGVTLDGRKDILGIVPDLTNKLVSVDFWDKILNHIQGLGCREICYIVAAFKCRYLERAVKNYYPQATMTFNLLELLQFDSFALEQNYRSEFMQDAAQLCNSANYEQGYELLNRMRDKWDKFMPEGATILQGNVEHLKVHTLLGLPERKIFTTHKMISSAAALLLGKKDANDFFSDNAELLNYLFYRYLLQAKPYWTEHQDYAIYNLSFSKLFTQLRHLDISGSKLLNELLSEQHQEFMHRHFGSFGNGPVFNLNPNKKRISLAGQIDDNAALLGDNWEDTSNAALNTAPEQELKALSSVNKAVKNQVKPTKATLSSEHHKTQPGPVITNSAPVLTLNTTKALSTAAFMVNKKSINDTPLSFESTNSLLSLDNLLTFENQAIGALGGSVLPKALNPHSASLTLCDQGSSALVLGGCKSIPAPSKLALAIGLEYPRFKHSHILINGQEYALTHAALGELDQEQIKHRVLDNHDNIIDGTYGFDLKNSSKLIHSDIVSKALDTLSSQYDIDSLSGLEGLDKLDPTSTVDDAPNNNYSSNIQSANAVMGMLRPSIAQALRQERLDLKQQERYVILQCLGSHFNFDALNNVINQITPIFRTAMQAKITRLAEQDEEKKVQERKKKKAKAHERYLKRQAAKAQQQPAVSDKDFEPLSAKDFNTVESLDESIAMQSSQQGPITVSASGTTGTNTIIIPPNTNTMDLSTDDTTLEDILNTSESTQLTLTKPSEAKVQVVAAPFRSAIAEQLATIGGVQTQKPDDSIKVKD